MKGHWMSQLLAFSRGASYHCEFVFDFNFQLFHVTFQLTQARSQAIQPSSSSPEETCDLHANQKQRHVDGSGPSLKACNQRSA